MSDLGLHCLFLSHKNDVWLLQYLETQKKTCQLCHDSKDYNLLPWPGFESGLSRPQREVLTTIRSRLSAGIYEFHMPSVPVYMCTCICIHYHQSFVTTPPLPPDLGEGGDSRANIPRILLLHCLNSAVEISGIWYTLVIMAEQCNVQ